MRRFLSVVGPIALTLAFWTAINKIPLPGFVILTLVIVSGVLMLFGMGYLFKIMSRHK